MTPIEFPEHNTVLAKDQPQYLPLPIHLALDQYGTAISCWRLTWKERFKLLWTGELWLSQLTFGTLLQPQRPSVHKSDMFEEKK